MGQISRIDCLEQSNLVHEGIMWRKVDNKVLKEMISGIGKRDGGRDEIIWVTAKLPRARLSGGGNCNWWGKETERISLDVKFMRRRRRGEGNESWKLARSVYRNTILNY